MSSMVTSGGSLEAALEDVFGRFDESEPGVSADNAFGGTGAATMMLSEAFSCCAYVPRPCSKPRIQMERAGFNGIAIEPS
jgi:hypothetical protein